MARTAPMPRRRKRTRLFFAIILLPFVIVFIATRSFVVTMVVQNTLQNEFGSQILVGESHLDWSGGITIENVRLKARGITGAASDVLTIHSARIVLDNFFSFQKTKIVSLEIDTITVRLAESATNPSIHNVSQFVHQFIEDRLELAEEDDDATHLAQLPEISLKELLIETGQMDQGTWAVIGKRTFAVAPQKVQANTLGFKLVDSSNELSIHVKYDQARSNITIGIDQVRLDNSLFELLPLAARVWCEQADITGGLKDVLASWNPTDGLVLSGQVEDLHFLLQEKHGLPWVHYQNGLITHAKGASSLEVVAGEIFFDGSSIVLQDLQGSLHPPTQESDAPVSFLADIKISDLPSPTLDGGGWIASAIATSTFNGAIQIEEFTSTGKLDEEVDLPLAAAQVLKFFHMEQWRVKANVVMTRKVSGGPIDIHGDLLIDADLGKFEGFPYPLHGIKSHIIFHQDEIEVVYLQARGSADAPIHISGGVQAASDYLFIDLNLHVEGAPLDQLLHDSVPRPMANVMDGLFNKEALRKIENVFPDTPHQTFVLGGAVDIDLSLKHDSNISNMLDVSGEISLQDVGIIIQEFPYPITLQEGTVLLDATGLHVPEGEVIRFKGFGGGLGELKGSILFNDGGLAKPDLVLSLTSEKINATLIEAISISAKDSYETALGVLGGLGLVTRLKVDGQIYGDGEKINTNFTAYIEDGVATPSPQLAKAIHASDAFWPEDLQLTHLNAEINVMNGVVTMDAATCEFGAGYIDVSMSVNKGEFDLALNGVDLPLSSRFAKVLPISVSRRLVDSWSWLEPGGLMDAEIRMNHKDGESSLYMEVTPVLVTVSGKGQTVDLELMRGSVIVDDTDIYLHQLDFQLQEDGEPQGLLQIRGEVHAESLDYQFNFGANWEAASISSPLSRAIVGMVGDQAGIDYYDSIQPVGYASATLDSTGDSETITYDIRVIPSVLSTNFHGRRADAVFEESNSANDNLIRFDNSGIRFESLHGKLGDGDFTLEGVIETSSGIDGSFDLTWNGGSGDSSLLAVLPSSVADKLEAIELSGGTSNLPNGTLNFVGDSWSELAVSFRGNIKLDDVEISVGIPLKDIAGEIFVGGYYNEKLLSELQLSLEIDEMEALGRTISYIDGELVLDTSQQRLLFKNMRGESSTGGVSIDGWLGVDETREYEIEVLVAGLELENETTEGKLATLQGELTGWFSIAGVQGDPSSRRGAGKLQVHGGYLAVDPLSMKTMQVLQLAMPFASSITGADIELFIDDTRMVLDKITFTCSDSDVSDLVLEGEGTIDVENFNLHARLHPRAGLPVLREITGAIFDQLYSIDITGELFDPNVSVVFFPFLKR